MSVSDNEWAAGVMGLEPHDPPRSVVEGEEHILLVACEPREDALGLNWRSFDPAHDANDFRDFLNCEVVRTFPFMVVGNNPSPRQRAWAASLNGDQPAALRRLREALEEQK